MLKIGENMKVNKKLEKFGVRAADILLPKSGTDLEKWAVVACDQYTSERDYWESLKEEIGSSPSTLPLIFPEVYLEDNDKEDRIKNINKTMNEYMSDGTFTEYPESFILVKRTTESGTRYGLMVALDLECYDYSKDSKTLIRATEGTILSRIPPRVEIRKDAPIELPHIMVLINDKNRKIIEPLAENKDNLHLLYDTELNKNGGRLTGYLVNDEKYIKGIVKGFKNLYSSLDKQNPLMFAMGDGNHSLATAYTIWNEKKKTLTEEEKKNDKARFALVELENIFDPGLQFEPIHRVFFGLSKNTFDELLSSFCTSFDQKECKDKDEMLSLIASDGQHFGLISGENFILYTVNGGQKKIASGTIQGVIDKMLSEKKGEVDYIHGVDVVINLSKKEGNLGLILPPINKDNFFHDMILDGAYPRKTFSIGHANEKRYYMEARKIK